MAEFVPKNAKERSGYARFLMDEYDPDWTEWPWNELKPPRNRKPRKPNVTTLIKRARKAGERGEVRVEMVNSDGTRTIVTSSRDQAPEMMTDVAHPEQSRGRLRRAGIGGSHARSTAWTSTLAPAQGQPRQAPGPRSARTCMR
jgi:hypothetical protein